MSEVVCDPDRLFLCPRCGRPVTYKGRGRRPVWCSARCRVEASIERRGNRIVGVEPRVVTVVPPTQRLSQWEKDRRQQIEEALDRDAVVAAVAREPYLLIRVLERIEEEGLNGSEATRQIVAQGLARTVRVIAADGVEPDGASSTREHKRGVEEWVSLLEALAIQLSNGQFYNRDLPAIDGPLRRLIERYARRLKSASH